nr:hypothetical protein [Tanacetum cinerariifolium]
VYSLPKKDMSWTGLPEFADDTITDYSRSSPTIKSNSDDLQNRNPYVTETRASSSTILSKPTINFVKSADRPTETKTDKVENARKSTIKYAELYRKTSKSSNVRGNQRNWNNLNKWVEKGNSRPKNNHTHKSMPPRAIVHKNIRSPLRTNRPNMNAAQPKRTSFYKLAHSYVKRPFQRRSANNIDDKGYWDSGCSRHMTGNISYLSDYEPYNGGYVSFGQGGCKITGKGTIKI